MANYVLVAATNLSSMPGTSAPPNAGDTITLGAWTLTVNQNLSVAFTILANNALSQIVSSGTFSLLAAVTITVSASLTTQLIQIIGNSLTMTNVSATWTITTGGGLFNISSGTLSLSSSGTLITTDGNAGNSNVQSGGTLSINGNVSTIATANQVFACSGGTFSASGTWTNTGTAGSALVISGTGSMSSGSLNLVWQGTASVISITGSAAVPYTNSGSITNSGTGSCISCTSTAGVTLNHTGNITSSGSLSSIGVVSLPGTSITCNITGNVTVTNAIAAGSNFGLYSIGTSNNIVLTGDLLSGSGAVGAYLTAGTFTWTNQTVVIGSSQECTIIAQQSGQINISGLIVTNSGKISITRFSGTSDITTNGTTALNNQTSTAQGCLTGGTWVVTNQPSTVANFPQPGHVLAGDTFGYVGALQTGTGSVINEAAIGTALAAGISIPTVSQIGSYLTALFEATILPVNVMQAQGANIGGTAGFFQMDMAQSLPAAPAANSVGESLFIGDLFGGRVNTAQGGSSSTITLDAGASSDATAYCGDDVYLYGGTGGGVRGTGQRRTIVAYNTATKVATVNRAWDTVPDATTKFITLPQPQANLGLVQGTQISTPATAGILDVNTKNIGNHAAPLDGNNLLQVDLVDIRGTASTGAAGYVGIDFSQTADDSATVSLPNVTIGTVTQLTDAPSVPTAAAIATQVWQDLLSDADFSTAGSIGALLKIVATATEIASATSAIESAIPSIAGLATLGQLATDLTQIAADITSATSAIEAAMTGGGTVTVSAFSPGALAQLSPRVTVVNALSVTGATRRIALTSGDGYSTALGNAITINLVGTFPDVSDWTAAVLVQRDQVIITGVAEISSATTTAITLICSFLDTDTIRLAPGQGMAQVRLFSGSTPVTVLRKIPADIDEGLVATPIVPGCFPRLFDPCE